MSQLWKFQAEKLSSLNVARLKYKPMACSTWPFVSWKAQHMEICWMDRYRRRSRITIMRTEFVKDA